jgi:hypothetical protein
MDVLHRDGELSEQDLEAVVGGLARAWEGDWQGADRDPGRPIPNPGGEPVDPGLAPASGQGPG